jgi:hypothetical protein
VKRRKRKNKFPNFERARQEPFFILNALLNFEKPFTTIKRQKNETTKNSPLDSNLFFLFPLRTEKGFYHSGHHLQFLHFPCPFLFKTIAMDT